MYSISTAATYLHVSPVTLRRWDAAGYLVPKRTFGNHRRYTQEQLDNYLGICNEGDGISESKSNENAIRHLVAYARVSTQKQDKEGNLDRQAERLENE